MGIGRPEERGVPDLNVIGQIDLHRTLDPLLIDAGEVVAGPVVFHRIVKDSMVPRQRVIMISGSLLKKHSESEL